MFCLHFPCPHPLGASQVSTAKVPKLIPFWNKQKPELGGHTAGSPGRESDHWSLMTLAKAKFRQSSCVYRSAVCRGNAIQGPCVFSVHLVQSSLLPSVKESWVYLTKPPSTGKDTPPSTFPQLHAVAFKRQIVIRSFPFWSECPSVTVWLTLFLLSTC